MDVEERLLLKRSESGIVSASTPFQVSKVDSVNIFLDGQRCTCSEVPSANIIFMETGVGGVGASFGVSSPWCL